MNQQQFELELTELINKHSIENGSNTPDFMLAAYLVSCLNNWNTSIMEREKWYGRVKPTVSAPTTITVPCTCYSF